MGRVGVCLLVIALAVCGAGHTEAQAATAAVPETSVGVVLRNLAARAGVVFVGQVVRIERTAGTVDVVFQVQQQVLGAVGATYTLREWSALWAGGQQRYRLGERTMIFLHKPNSRAGSAGLSSPVDGMEGVVPVVMQGADAPALLDVRWLAARVRRPVGAPIVDAQDGAITLADGAAVASSWNQTQWTEPPRQPLPAGVEPAQPLPRPQPVNVAPSLGLVQVPTVQVPSSGIHQTLGARGTTLTAPVDGANGGR